MKSILKSIVFVSTLLSLAASSAIADQNVRQFVGEFKIDQRNCNLYRRELYETATISVGAKPSELKIQISGAASTSITMINGHSTRRNPNADRPIRSIVMSGYVKGAQLVTETWFILTDGARSHSATEVLTNKGDRLTYVSAYAGEMEEESCDLIRK